MGDFFARLAEKTLGVAPLVKPDLVPLFATSHTDTISEPVSPQESSAMLGKSATTSAAQPRPNSAFRQTAVRDPYPQIQTQTLQGARSSDDGLASPDRSAVEIVDEFTTPAVAPNVDRWEPGKTAKESKAPEPSILAKISERIFAEPAGEFRQSLRVSKATLPAVQVTIGRVEVRAMLPSAPAPRIIERKASPRLTLEQYLRARNEGRR